MAQRINVPGMGVVEFPDGMSDDQITAAIKQNMPEQVSTGTDVAKSFGAGIGKGAIGLAGMIDDFSEYGARGLDRATRAIGGAFGADIAPRQDQTPQFGSEAITKGVESVTGEFYKPQTTLGKYAGNVGEFAAGMVGGPTGLARRAATQVVLPGIASEAAGQAAEGTGYETAARIAGGVAGGVAPALVGRAVTPLPVNAARADAANVLRNEGVTGLTAGQVTGRKSLQYLEMERGNGANMVERQGEQFTAAALRRVGENADRATPEVIDNAFRRLGTEFDYLAQNNTARFDNALIGDLRRSTDDYNNLVSPPNRTPAVDNFLTEIANAAVRSGGNIPGDAYQSLRSRMERAARGMGNNPEARNAIRDMREALDDAMERSIRRAGRPDDIQAWQDARRQYRSLITIERAATGAGEQAALGIISPKQLRAATVNQNRRAYARGDGDFADLARSGEALMTPLPNSGTPGRMAAQNLSNGPAAIVGAMLGGSAGSAAGPIGTTLGVAAGAVAGNATPRLAGRLATSQVGRDYLTNQLAAPMLNNLRSGQSALVAALLAERSKEKKRNGARRD